MTKKKRVSKNIITLQNIRSFQMKIHKIFMKNYKIIIIFKWFFLYTSQDDVIAYVYPKEKKTHEV